MIISRILQVLQSHQLAFASLATASLSFVLVYYQQEPAPADYLMAFSIALAGLSFLLRRKFAPFSWIDLPIFGYLLYVIAQAVIQFETLDIRFALITAYLVSTYFVVKYLVVIKPEYGLKWLFRAYMVGAVITSLVMIYQMISVYSFGGDWGALYWGRPNGWFKDANVAGPFLLPAIFFGFYSFIIRRSWQSLVLFLISSSGLFLSFSRGAYLGYICGMVLLLVLILYLNSKRGKEVFAQSLRVGAIAVTSAIILFICWSGYQPFSKLATERFGELIKDYDTQGRASAWEAGINESSDSIFGNGSGNFEKESMKYLEELESSGSASPGIISEESSGSAQQSTSSASLGDPNVPGSRIVTKSGEQVIVTPSAHSTYIRVLLENGIVGLSLLVIGWTVLALAGGKALWQLSKSSDWLNEYAVVAWVSFLAYLPMGTFIDTLHWRYLWIISGLLGGIIYLVNIQRWHDSSQKE